MITKTALIAPFLCVISISWAIPVTRAAQQSSQQAGAAVSDLEEVIITARKREESYLDVPVIANVITQETLEQYKTDDLFAIATRVPGLLLGNGVISVGTQVSLRGVGTTALNTTMDQSVSLNIDGLSLSQGTAYGVGMFDVAQVEVFKGPQALFFGKNNTAGVISLRSADPTDKVEVITRMGYEREASEKEFDLVLSGPVTDSLKLRLATRYSDQDGFFINHAIAAPGLGGLTPGFTNYAPTKEWIARGTVLFQPNEVFTARLKLNHSNFKMNGGSSPFQVTYCPEGTGAVPPSTVAYLSGDDCSANRVINLPWADPAAYPAGNPNGGIPFDSRTLNFGTLDLNFRLSKGLTLNSVTGYSYNSFYMLHVGGTDDITTPYMGITNFHDREVTQEVRLTSDYSDSPVNFMVGAFYQDGTQEQELSLTGNARLSLPPIVQHALNIVDIHSTSLFGQFMWNVTPQLELSAGARWTDERRTHKETNFNLAQGPLGPVSLLDPKISSSNVSPELTVTYKPTTTLTAFASYKTGNKSGSFNGINFVPPTLLSSFKDEKAKGGELGIKSLLADRKLAVNIAAYYYKYSDLQVGAQELSLAGPGSFIVLTRTLNAGAAKVYGVDLDGNYSPAAIQGLTFSAAMEFNRARWTSFPNAPCGGGQTISQGCNQLFNPSTGRYTAQDLAGHMLVRAPDVSGFVGFDQAIGLGDDRTMHFGASANYTSKYLTGLIDEPGLRQDSFVKFDANVALRGKDSKWEFALIGRNITNEFTSGWCVNNNAQNGTIFGGQISGAAVGGPAGQDEAVCYVERGRELWGRLSFKL